MLTSQSLWMPSSPYKKDSRAHNYAAYSAAYVAFQNVCILLLHTFTCTACVLHAYCLHVSVLQPMPTDSEVVRSNSRDHHKQQWTTECLKLNFAESTISTKAECTVPISWFYCCNVHTLIDHA